MFSMVVLGTDVQTMGGFDDSEIAIAKALDLMGNNINDIH
ncbi:hypothetical protein MAMP_00069 [Methylophaga aminisulfidivorans MP]|uniref:Uncharacterized protein n=1 Tax=Methylophaga aminisulfidivorans MP TaxID=1026882 RepID=F5T0K2_9GAMM|nr:hypothetical protein MAMP_00069 [Methylophaga aminisulfidivorans MP]